MQRLARCRFWDVTASAGHDPSLDLTPRKVQDEGAVCRSYSSIWQAQLRLLAAFNRDALLCRDAHFLPRWTWPCMDGASAAHRHHMEMYVWRIQTEASSCKIRFTYRLSSLLISLHDGFKILVLVGCVFLGLFDCFFALFSFYWLYFDHFQPGVVHYFLLFYWQYDLLHWMRESTNTFVTACPTLVFWLHKGPACVDRCGQGSKAALSRSVPFFFFFSYGLF